MRILSALTATVFAASIVSADEIDLRLDSQAGVAFLAVDDAQVDVCQAPAQHLVITLQLDDINGVAAPAGLFGATAPVRVVTRRANQHVEQSEVQPGRNAPYLKVSETIRAFSVSGTLMACAFGPQFDVLGGEIQIDGAVGNYEFDLADSLSGIRAVNQTNVWMHYDTQPYREGPHGEKRYSLPADQLVAPDRFSQFEPIGLLRFHIDAFAVRLTPTVSGIDPLDVVARLSTDFVVVASTPEQ